MWGPRFSDLGFGGVRRTFYDLSVGSSHYKLSLKSLSGMEGDRIARLLHSSPSV